MHHKYIVEIQLPYSKEKNRILFRLEYRNCTRYGGVIIEEKNTSMVNMYNTIFNIFSILGIF